MSRNALYPLAAAALLFVGCIVAPVKKAVPLFDGKTFNGWEGDTVKTWKIESGAIAGGSLSETVPHNEFLCTRKPYANFILKVKFKLIGNEGFVNTGVQFHSVRSKDPAYEMIGYQADLGDKFWASLYDESRRNMTLIAPDSALIEKILKRNEWNDYEVHSQNGRIQLFLNGTKTVDYTEPDKSIPQKGLIALQIHGGGKAKVYYKDIWIEEL
ncbi:3-keto-disaccharide hydrolase [Dyadobacter sp.]|uniref:3-keto-disaccharide hydrolase n=1 Tax=Dyadobacter sp. TaxID=1914288 RepID=UPI003F6ECDDA